MAERPKIRTSDPVTAPTPPPDEQPFDVDLVREIHEPAVPLAVLLYGRLADGLPKPTYPELTVNRQPAVHTVQTVGQLAGRA